MCMLALIVPLLKWKWTHRKDQAGSTQLFYDYLMLIFLSPQLFSQMIHSLLIAKATSDTAFHLCDSLSFT